MDISVIGSKAEALLNTSKTEARSLEDVLKGLLQEGRVLSARPVVQSGEQVLLKLADVLLPVKTDAENIMNAEKLLLKVERAGPENIFLEIEGQINQNEKTSNFPQMKLAFIPDAENSIVLDKTNIKPGDILPLKLIQSGENSIKVQIAGQEIELKAQLEELSGQNIKLKLDFANKENPRLLLVENGQSTEKTQLLLEKTTSGRENTSPEQISPQRESSPLKNEENLQLMKELFSQVKTEINLKGQTNLPENILKFSLAEGEKLVSNFKNVSFEDQSLKTLEFKNQEILNFSKITFNEKTGLVEAILNDEKLFLKPILELKENQNVFLKYQLLNNKASFSLDHTSLNENKELIKDLVMKLGDFVLEDKDIPEIVKSIIENKIPLTKENIQASQNFLNFFPADPKTSLDLFLNQNILLGLYYQLNESKDRFILKGYKKNQEEKRQKRESNYEFTVLYESEFLGNILIDLEWSKNLELDFFCQEESTALLIESTMGDLKDALKVKNIQIRVEHNQEKLKKDPVKREKISLSNIDISV